LRVGKTVSKSRNVRLNSRRYSKSDQIALLLGVMISVRLATLPATRVDLTPSLMICKSRTRSVKDVLAPYNKGSLCLQLNEHFFALPTV